MLFTLIDMGISIPNKEIIFLRDLTVDTLFVFLAIVYGTCFDIILHFMSYTVFHYGIIKLLHP